jgi:hypothetical protein
MTHLHCPNCGKRIEIESVGEFTLRWSTQKCVKCGVELSIRYDPNAMFVRYSQEANGKAKPVQAIA